MEKTLAPYAVASRLRNKGYQVTVIHHLSVFTIQEILDILSNIISEHTLFVGINDFFYRSLENLRLDKNGAIEYLTQCDPGSFVPHGKKFNHDIKQIIKDKNPNCKIALGGPNAIDHHNNRDYDYVIMGYSENSVFSLADHLKNHSPLAYSRRSIFGYTILDDSKAQGYDFVNSSVTLTKDDCILPGETMMLEVGRGCIFKCSFCSYPLNGKKKLDFIRTIDSLYQELVYNYEQFNTTQYLLIDDTFNDSVDKCRLFRDLSKRLPFKMKWWGFLRLDLLAAHPETIDWLWESGMTAVFYGIETLDSKAAKAIGKGGSRDKLISTIMDIKKRYGNHISQHGSFIYGLPYETRQSLDRTRQWLTSSDNPLDSWHSTALTIRDPNILNNTNGFVSDIDNRWQHYGYRDTGLRHQNYLNGSGMIWENDEINYSECHDWAQDDFMRSLSVNNRVQGRRSLMWSGLDIDHSELQNRLNSEINWYQLDQKKYSRAQEYRATLYQSLELDPSYVTAPEINIYSEFLKQNFIKTKN